MDRIVCVVGPSGSGKTTVAKELEKLGYNIIKSYTNRKPRVKDEYGHIFVNEKYKDTDDTIAYTKFADYEYWATRDQYKNKGISIYIICPQGANELREKVKDAEIVSIYLDVSESVRRNRMDNENRIDTEKRILHDRKRFENITCDYTIDANKEIDHVMEQILSIDRIFDKMKNKN